MSIKLKYYNIFKKKFCCVIMKNVHQRPVTFGPLSKLDSQEFMRNNSGELLQKYIKELEQNFAYYQAITCRKQKRQIERILYSTLLVKFHEMINANQTSIEKILKKLKKYHTKVMENDDFKNCDKYLQHIINSIANKLQQINYLPDAHDRYLCQLLRAICNINPTNSILGFFANILNSQPNYGKAQLQKINQALGYTFVIFDFDQDKKMIKYSVDQQFIYILKAKYLYYYLLPNNSNRALLQLSREPPEQLISSGIKPINIVREKQLSANQLEHIFLKQGVTQKSQQKQKQPKADIFFQNKIACAVCKTQESQSDCLHWNYAYYCESCVINPLMDTSNIPPNLLMKYLKERDLIIKEYPLQCPECKSTHVFRKYDPTKKPSFFICQMCKKTICIEHLGLVQRCFCYCKTCKRQTMNIIHLNMRICQFCNKKKCIKCGSQGKKLCSCICKSCLQDNSQNNHLCEKKCHSCLNAIPNLKTCYCGMLICYGCFYKFLSSAQNGNYNCSFIDFQ